MRYFLTSIDSDLVTTIPPRGFAEFSLSSHRADTVALFVIEHVGGTRGLQAREWDTQPPPPPPPPFSQAL